MSTVLNLFSLPLVRRELLARESGRQSSAGSASPPRRSVPPAHRGPSDPPPKPDAAVSGSWEWCTGGDSSMHQRLAVASIFAGRIG